MKKRLFLAIPLSEEIKNELDKYKNETVLESIRWIPSKNLHITLYFLGDVKEEEIPELIDDVNSALLNTKSFSLIFEKMTFAPPNETPRMIWVQFKKHKNYDELCRILYNAAHKFSNRPTSKPDDSKENIAHITIARFKKEQGTQGTNLKQPQITNLVVKSCHLMESKPNSDGSVYSTVATFFLNVI